MVQCRLELVRAHVTIELEFRVAIFSDLPGLFFVFRAPARQFIFVQRPGEGPVEAETTHIPLL